MLYKNWELRRDMRLKQLPRGEHFGILVGYTVRLPKPMGVLGHGANTQYLLKTELNQY